jgi:uncharacterized membrane protein YkoI
MNKRTFAAVALVAAIAVPAGAQSTSTTGTRTTTTEAKSNTTITNSNGAIADTVAKITTTVVTKDSTKLPAPGATAGEAAAPSLNAAPAAGVATPSTTTAAPAAPAEGQVKPTEAARVDVKVAQSLAATTKISADSAYALARANSTKDAEISSAELEMKDGRLVYEIKLLNKNKGASEVTVDAMTGEVVKDKKFGGAKAVLEHHKENKKLLDAKRDSSGTKAP